MSPDGRGFQLVRSVIHTVASAECLRRKGATARQSRIQAKSAGNGPEAGAALRNFCIGLRNVGRLLRITARLYRPEYHQMTLPGGRLIGVLKKFSQAGPILRLPRIITARRGADSRHRCRPPRPAPGTIAKTPEGLIESRVTDRKLIVLRQLHFYLDQAPGRHHLAVGVLDQREQLRIEYLTADFALRPALCSRQQASEARVIPNGHHHSFGLSLTCGQRQGKQGAAS